MAKSNETIVVLDFECFPMDMPVEIGALAYDATSKSVKRFHQIISPDDDTMKGYSPLHWKTYAYIVQNIHGISIDTATKMGMTSDFTTAKFAKWMSRLGSGIPDQLIVVALQPEMENRVLSSWNDKLANTSFSSFPEVRDILEEFDLEHYRQRDNRPHKLKQLSQRDHCHFHKRNTHCAAMDVSEQALWLGV